MRTFMKLCCLSFLAPSMAQAQVQFVPYNPVLPPFRSVSFSRDILPPLVVNPAPANQVFVVIDAYDLLARRMVIDAAGSPVAEPRYMPGTTLSSVVSPFAIDRAIVPVGLPAAQVVTDMNYAVNAAIASVAPPLPVRRIVMPSAEPAAETKPAITLASIKPKNAGPNDPRYPGWFVLAESDMQDRLRLTPAQRAAIEKATAENNGGVRPAAIASEESNREFTAQRRASRERFLQMLSAEQQQMWTQLTGDPHEFRPNW
ncbi:MAG: hypothetical protein U0744_15905 [Gemmataceae bacterium]